MIFPDHIDIDGEPWHILDEKIDCGAAFHDEFGRTEEERSRLQKEADGLNVCCIHRL